MSEAARNGRAKKIRRRLSIFHTMRQPSANDGGGSSVSRASVTPMAMRSWIPRLGSPQAQAEDDQDHHRDGEAR